MHDSVARNSCTFLLQLKKCTELQRFKPAHILNPEQKAHSNFPNFTDGGKDDRMSASVSLAYSIPHHVIEEDSSQNFCTR